MPAPRAISMVLLLAVAAAAIGAGYYLASRETRVPELPARPAARVPEVRPLFVLEDVAGASRSITEWDGRALMINFWATWCAPCRREIPLLNTLRAQYAARGFEVVGVAVDFRDDVLEYMKTTPIDYPVLIGEQDGLEVARAFGMETMGFPATVFTDRLGRIVTIHVGELHAYQADAILSTVLEVEAGALDLAAARERIRVELAELAAERA